jgi:peptidoglycan/LPS O-acetylase OafA/YrhL
MKAIHSIQYLRGIAALMVVLVHLPLQLTRFGYEGTWPEYFIAGVDIFFVISGLIMWVTTCNSSVTPQQFLFRRLVRVAPLYWLLSAFTVSVMLLSPAMIQSGSLDWGHIVSSFLFLPALHPVTAKMEPVLVPGWTLNYEMFFYLLFAACMFLPVKRRPLAMIASLAAIALAGLAFTDKNTMAGFYTSSIIIEFGFGILIGVMLTSGRTLPAPLAIASIAIGIVGIAASDLYHSIRLVEYGIPAAFIVLGAVMYERSHELKKNAPLHFLGDASYSLYLSHGIVLSALGQLWRKLHLTELPGSYIAFAITGLALCILVAAALFRFGEQLLIELFRTRRKPALQPS